MLEIWLKAAHIGFLALWAAGLVALPSLLGPRTEPTDGEYARRLRFSRLAFELVVSPAAIFTVATGVALVFVASWETPWLAVKLTAVGGMGLLHMLIGRGLGRTKRRLEPGRGVRVLITLGALACISTVLVFVLGKPDLSEDLLPAFLRDGRPDGFLETLPGFLSGLAGETAAAGALLLVVRRRDPEAVLEDELAAVPPGKADEDELHHRDQEAPGQDRRDVVAHAMGPAEREHAEQRHRDDAVGPGGGTAAGAGHEHHLAEAGQRRGAAHHEGRAGAPERGAREERIERPPIGGVGRRDPEHARDREGDEHRVDRVAEQGDATVEIADRLVIAMGRSDDVAAVRGHRVSLGMAASGLVAAATAGCAGPLSTLDPAGPSADRVATLWWVMFAGATLILVGVCTLAIIPFLQARRSDAVSSRAPNDAVWLWGGGIAFPIVTLFALMMYAFAVDPIDDAARTGEPPVRVEATARQWEWTFVHEDAPGGPLATRGSLHIPVGRPVELALTSEDVIHSFWVPRIAGKRDAIPGRVNTLTILADRPGTYRGICAEFCGEGHTGMGFEVIAHEAQDYPDALARLAATRARPDRREASR